MRVSRPCYDKMHRCPGWAGGGMLAARRQRCADGYLVGDVYRGWGWRLRLNRCAKCDVIVLPHAVRWLDWRWYRWLLGRRFT